MDRRHSTALTFSDPSATVGRTSDQEPRGIPFSIECPTHCPATHKLVEALDGFVARRPVRWTTEPGVVRILAHRLYVFRLLMTLRSSGYCFALSAVARTTAFQSSSPPRPACGGHRESSLHAMCPCRRGLSNWRPHARFCILSKSAALCSARRPCATQIWVAPQRSLGFVIN